MKKGSSSKPAKGKPGGYNKGGMVRKGKDC